jgi:hypothetical protein
MRQVGDRRYRQREPQQARLGEAQACLEARQVEARGQGCTLTESDERLEPGLARCMPQVVDPLPALLQFAWLSQAPRLLPVPLPPAPQRFVLAAGRKRRLCKHPLAGTRANSCPCRLGNPGRQPLQPHRSRASSRQPRRPCVRADAQFRNTPISFIDSLCQHHVCRILILALCPAVPSRAAECRAADRAGGRRVYAHLFATKLPDMIKKGPMQLNGGHLVYWQGGFTEERFGKGNAKGLARLKPSNATIERSRFAV